MQRILVYSRSDLGKDPRVYRQMETLAPHYEIIPAGFNPPNEQFPESIDLSEYSCPKPHGNSLAEKLRNLVSEGTLYEVLGIVLASIAGKLHASYHVCASIERVFLERRIIKKLSNTDCDLIIGNDLSALRVCCRAKKQRRLIYDAHEYSPGQFDGSRRGLQKAHDAQLLLGKYLPSVDLMITVCQGISERYAEDFRISPPEVITNASQYIDQSPSSREDGKIKLVHHGHAARSRMIEEMIDSLLLLDDRFELHFYLISHDEDYYRSLMERAAGDRRIVFHAPVPMNQLTKELNGYDLGFYILPPVNYNQLHALPNKLFEFIQARLGIAIGPSPEMGAYVRNYDLGIVAAKFTPEALAEELGKLDTHRVKVFKDNADRYARDLSSGPQMEKLKGIVLSALDKV